MTENDRTPQRSEHHEFRSPPVVCQNCGFTEEMASRPHNPALRDCPDCDDPQLEMV